MGLFIARYIDLYFCVSNISLVIEAQAREIGSFFVGRLLPFHQKRMVGPFIYIDYMGPVNLPADQNLDEPPHPHIGLSTLNCFLEGSMMHRCRCYSQLGGRRDLVSIIGSSLRAAGVASPCT